YPPEMLDLDMALDADLGIDSIKRVEILSALQERLPDAPPVKPEHLGMLQNLRQISEFLGATAPAPAPVADAIRSTISEAPPPAWTTVERRVLCAVGHSDILCRDSAALAPGAEIWISSDDADLAEHLGERIRNSGFRTRLAPAAALRHIEPPASLGGLILLAPDAQPDDGLLKDALFAAQRAGPALRRAGRDGGAIFVAVSRMDGAFGLGDLDRRRDPVDGGLAGLAKTASCEWPDVCCKAIDLGRDWIDGDEAADALAKEIMLAGPKEIGLSRSGSRTLKAVERPLNSASDGPLFEPGDVIVATGGGRGVTAEAVVALARAYRPTLVLLGRSPAPEPEPDWLAPLSAEAEIKRALGTHLNGDATPRMIGEQYHRLTAQRETRRTVARIVEAGGRAVYMAVDVRDAATTAEALRRIRSEYGPVRGLIHGAGVLADALIADKTEEQFNRVYETKVVGLRNMLAALAADELRALALFSSSTGRFGRAGQVDYAIANEVLNKAAQRYARLLPECRVVSVNWGPWQGGMVTPSLRKLFDDEGVGLIDLPAGAEFLVRELNKSTDTAVEVVAFAPSRPKTDQAAGERRPEASGMSAARGLAPAFERVLDVAEHPVLESHVLDGRPVLPLALTLEWLAHGALHENPGLTFHGCDDLRVLHGVVLDGKPRRLRVLAGKAVKKDGCYRTPVELHGLADDGGIVLHARAEVLLTADLPPAPAPRPAAAKPLRTFTPAEIYPRVLFHGPDMQGIEAVEACDDRGIAARLRSAPAPSEWLRRPLRQKWIADPLVLDGGFQLMILWSFARNGAAGLPCYVAQYRQYRRSFPTDGARVVLNVTKATGPQAIGDLDFLSIDGEMIARMNGAECTLDRALERAFRRNQLANR
ncbi:MAG TPA: SDR family NAD(P)-dependent oxidoreductase, partial [Gemmataceae bacterium]|nr:SDR family NAD(P)-dependent oxidoreductase [Gemmataceae bacterium]